ncbi:LysR family transcriptional regulator, partial [Candidatus Albibeggiatoa sp. nov. BB20]|uniref:LysR family transcriptional regulator n=1 Tax=Candidatus Albibeggiatoa sp. nov. BB20 TaxID=3162723 RepID=UPI00336569E5
MNLPTIRQLQYLHAVMALRHFGKAAEQCHVTQSTLSSGIQELENLLGVTLFERTKHKVIPTVMGEKIATQAQQILQLSTELLEMSQCANQPLTGKLRLGVIPTIGPYLLPWILPEIRRLFPQLVLQLIEDQSEHLLDKLESGQLDTAILAFPYP